MFFKKNPNQVAKDLLALSTRRARKGPNLAGVWNEGAYSIPTDILIDVDSSKEKAEAILLGQFGPDLDFRIQYAYYRSLFEAASNAKLSGFVAKGAGILTAMTLSMIAIEDIENRVFQEAEWAGNELTEMANALQDAYFTVFGKMLAGIAYFYDRKAFVAYGPLSSALANLAQAEAQAHDGNALERLRKWATVASGVFDEVKKDPMVRHQAKSGESWLRGHQ